ncbi:MAG: helix-turn-helix domain-containing protein, partial [Ignisphaera sp.]
MNIEPLSRGELVILSILVKVSQQLSVEEIASNAGIPISTVFSVSELLREKGLVDILENEVTYAKTTDEGK